jgi:hypothetical protein
VSSAPATSGTAAIDQSIGRRALRLECEDDVLRELGRLRRGYVQGGKWTLAQIAWHVGLPIEKHLSPPPPGAQRTPEQEAIKVRFVDHIIATGTPPPGAKDAPPNFIPPETASDADIDRYEATLKRMKEYPHDRVMMGPIGPVTIAEFRACNIVHAVHHLSFLHPALPGAPRRRTGLSFADEDAVIADVQKLRRGHAKAASWSLAQTCYHLDFATKARMQPGPFPPNTPEQDARYRAVPKILAAGKLPDGINAPAQAVPPKSCDEKVIDDLIATLTTFKNFKGEIAPHRLFGKLSDSEARRLNLIHCAHHLSYLVPTENAGAELVTHRS